MNKYTSLELSKKLYENGCRLEGSGMHDKSVPCIEYEGVYTFIPYYDLLWDICVKYAEEFFDEHFYKDITESIFIMVQSKQHTDKEVEDYIWEHCKFNT